MAEEATRYPLSWPLGWARTPSARRKRAAFHSTTRQQGEGGTSWVRKSALTVGQALDRAQGELRRLQARRIVISSNLRIREDGLPYASQAKQLDDPGVAIYFQLNGQPRVLACDKWSSAAENLAAIAGHIAAIRAIDRYGVGTLDQAFAGYKALPARGETWRTTLGFSPSAIVTADDIEQAFRTRAKDAHPDKQGGSHDAMASLTAARTEALAELSN